MQLDGTTSIITGAASGIGAACARRFAAEGSRVAVVDVQADLAQTVADEIGGLAVTCDLGDPAAIADMARTVEAELGPVDVLFNNAGIAQGGGLLDSLLDEWQRQWDINCMAHVHALREVLPGMLERGRGYVVNTASMAGILSTHGNAPYAVSKHAVVGLTEWLAFTYQHRGIGVSLLAPLVVRTPMVGDQVDSAWATLAGGPVTEPEDVAAMVVDALGEERFLILTADVAQTWMEGKTADHDRWIRGMNRLQQRLEEAGEAGAPG